MFYLYTMISNIYKQKFKSILVICITALLSFMLNLYTGTIESNKTQLESLPDVIPVHCRIMNLNGSQESGLEISEELILNLEASPHVKDGAYSVSLTAGIGDFLIEEWREKLTLRVVGASRAEAVPGLDPESLQITYGTEEDFFASKEDICIVSSSLMQEEDLQIGDTILLNLYYSKYQQTGELKFQPLTLVPLRIAGTMEILDSATQQLPPDIILPFLTVCELYHENNIDFYADSASFYVADPLNLNACKEEMKSFRLLSVAPAARHSYQGIALLINDTVFLSLAGQLQQSIGVLQGFFPLIVITVIVIGYITSFLVIQQRQKEYALMRVLGTGRGQCFFVFFIEQLVLLLCGATAGSMTAFIAFRQVDVILKVLLLVLLSYLLGVMAALWRIGKGNVMGSLFQAE